MSKLDAFRKADWDEQVKMLADNETAQEVEGWLGPAAFAELKQLAPPAGDLTGGKNNLIVVPGVMGSMLQSAGEGGIWWLDVLRARDRLDQLALAPGGLNDASTTADIQPCSIDITYAPMRSAIAHSGDFGGSVQFPYDWRKPLHASAKALRDLVVRVYNDYGEPVHLVGHSMGGLMIRTTLMRHGAELWDKIGKIVFIATPHYGSTSIAGYLKNHLWGWDQMAVLGAYLSRDTFRSLWGVLELLPAPAGVYPGARGGEPHPCANFDLYKAAEYQLKLDATETVALQRALDDARQLHQDLYSWHQTLSPNELNRMLQISGVGRKTLFRLEVQPGWLGLWQDVLKVTDRDPDNPHREGDGRVPVAAAALEKIQVRYVKGEHGSVQNLPAVVQDVLAWVREDSLALADTPKGALAGHLAGGAASAAPLLDGSAAFSPHDDEYDRYRDLPEERVKELVQEFEAGRITGMDLARIL